MWQRIIISISLLAGLFSCKNDGSYEDAKNILNTEIRFNAGLHKMHPKYTVLRYVKPASCTSCQLQMAQWRIFNRRIQKYYGDSVSLFFVIETDKPNEVRPILKMYKFEEHAFIDSTGVFITENPCLVNVRKEIVLLLDSTNSAVLIGNPTKDIKIEQMYHSLFD